MSLLKLDDLTGRGVQFGDSDCRKQHPSAGRRARYNVLVHPHPLSQVRARCVLPVLLCLAACAIDTKGSGTEGPPTGTSLGPSTSSSGVSATNTTQSVSSEGSEAEAESESDMDTDTDSEPACEKVDFLLVLDTSSSMDQWDGKLIQLAIKFEEEITGVFLGEAGSFHFGVTTTDAYEDNPDGCDIPGAIVRFGGAQDVPCENIEGNPYATNADSLSQALGCMALVGDGSSNERPMEALLSAVSPELNKPGGCNEGFIRDDALLVVVIMTDEDDDPADIDGQGLSGSLGGPANWYNDLLAVKNGDPEAIVIGVLVGEDEDTGTCPWNLGPEPDESMASGAEEAKRIEQFVNMFPLNHRAVDSICRDDYVPFFKDLFTFNAQIACEEFIPPGS